MLGVNPETLKPVPPSVREPTDDILTEKSVSDDSSTAYIVRSGFAGSSVLLQYAPIETFVLLPQGEPVSTGCEYNNVDLHSGESVVVERTPAQFSAITLPQYVVLTIKSVVFVDDKTPQTVSLEIMVVPVAKLVLEN